MNEDRQVIIPVEQAEVFFYGEPVTAVRLEDGRIGAVISHMCKVIGIDRAGQVQRIKNDETITSHLVLAQIRTKGGPQAQDVLIAWAIPYWLTGIDTKRVAAKRREAIQRFKNEAADVLYRHFSQPRPSLVPTQATTTEIIPTTQPVQPAAPPSNAADEIWIEYHKQMIAFHEWRIWASQRLDHMEERQDQLEESQESLKARVEGVEEITRLIVQQLGPKPLSPEHQRTVQSSAKRLNEATGMPFPTIYDQLRQDFHVGTYKDIPDEKWNQVVLWFQNRIHKSRS